MRWALAIATRHSAKANNTGRRIARPARHDTGRPTPPEELHTSAARIADIAAKLSHGSAPQMSTIHGTRSPFSAHAAFGASLSGWLRVLLKHGGTIGATYIPRVLVITGMIVLNAPVRWLERLRFGRRISKAVVKAPVFILGHPRSGTTHLHYVMSRDAVRFRICVREPDAVDVSRHGPLPAKRARQSPASHTAHGQCENDRRCAEGGRIRAGVHGQWVIGDGLLFSA
ncbi:MAG: sulfotransferase [Flavobacteriales bacterium]|nr:sulfotransferase [Flavobacteriales bacterium]